MFLHDSFKALDTQEKAMEYMDTSKIMLIYYYFFLIKLFIQYC